MRPLQLFEQSLSLCVPCTGRVLHRQRILFLAPCYDVGGSTRQRSLQRLRLGPRAVSQVSLSDGSVRIAGIAFGWTAPTSAFGSVVSSP